MGHHFAMRKPCIGDKSGQWDSVPLSWIMQNYPQLVGWFTASIFHGVQHGGSVICFSGNIYRKQCLGDSNSQSHPKHADSLPTYLISVGKATNSGIFSLHTRGTDLTIMFWMLFFMLSRVCLHMVGLSLCKPNIDVQNNIVVQKDFEKNFTHSLEKPGKRKTYRHTTHTHIYIYIYTTSWTACLMTFAVHDCIG